MAERDGVSEAEVEAASCAMARLAGHADPYELTAHPASKSWDAPSTPRWELYREEATVSLSAASAARPASPGGDADALAREVERLTRERDEARAIVDRLRVDLANAAGGMAEHTCEGCGAALMVDEEAATTTDVVGCWPYVTGEDGHGECWRYRTAEGMDRAWPACALAPPRPSGGSVDETPTSAGSASDDKGIVSAAGGTHGER